MKAFSDLLPLKRNLSCELFLRKLLDGAYSQDKGAYQRRNMRFRKYEVNWIKTGKILRV